MTFSLDWDLFYKTSGIGKGNYPNFEKLVTYFVAEAERMLELGAGSGSEIPFFRGLKFGYHGIDGSESLIAHLKLHCPALADRLIVGDFTKSLPFGGGYDLIVDRASVPHNDTEAIRSCLRLVHAALKPGGIFISSDWFSTKHSEFERGEVVDAHTRMNYPDGQFTGVGKVHFSDEEEMCSLFSDFEGIFMQERVTRRPCPNALVDRAVPMRWVSSHFRFEEYRSAFWDVVVRKPL